MDNKLVNPLVDELPQPAAPKPITGLPESIAANAFPPKHSKTPSPLAVNSLSSLTNSLQDSPPTKTSLLILIMTMSMIFSLIAIIEPYSNVYAGEDTEKELCKENGGKWKDGECDFKTDDEDKADQFMEDVEKIEEFEEEKAALEDALCDDEDAEITNIPLCKSDDLTLGQAFAEKYNQENCEKYNGEWIDGECDFYENQIKKVGK